MLQLLQFTLYYIPLALSAINLIVIK